MTGDVPAVQSQRRQRKACNKVRLVVMATTSLAFTWLSSASVSSYVNRDSEPDSDELVILAQAEASRITIAPIILAKPASNIRLQIAIEPASAAPKRSFLRLRGLPPAASLSEGHVIAPGAWAVPLHSFGGWFMGHTVSTGHKNVEIRTAQYKASFDPAHCLRIAKNLVVAKIQNSRTLLRRNWKEGEAPESVMDAFKFDVDQARRAKSLDELLGFEGNAAARYFGQFQQMIRRNDEGGFDFDFNNRNRRPPTDPVNALLSFGYALLTRTWTVTLSGVGFDPYRGFYHQPRYGRPALALDMMEPFRPLVVDSSVLQVINNGEVKPSDFKSVAGSVLLDDDGRKRFIAAFERRLEHEITHPLFGYKLSYRRLLELQARLLARHLLGEIDDCPGFVTR